MPPETLPIRPDVLTIFAMLVLLLLQVPPVVASLKGVCDPTHTTAVPVIADGSSLKR